MSSDNSAIRKQRDSTGNNLFRTFLKVNQDEFFLRMIFLDIDFAFI